MYKLLISDQAFQDLEELPSKLISQILRELENVTQFPYAFKVSYRRDDLVFRRILVGDYLVFYVADRDARTVEVTSVRHGSSQLPGDEHREAED